MSQCRQLLSLLCKTDYLEQVLCFVSFVHLLYNVLVFTWQQLAESMDEFGSEWELNPGDGAFYGPKVRRWRCSYTRHNDIYKLCAQFIIVCNLRTVNVLLITFWQLSDGTLALWL